MQTHHRFKIFITFALGLVLPFAANAQAQTALIAPNAQDQDVFKLTAGYSLQTDSNLFRLAASVDPAAVIGRSSAAEQIGTTSLGLKLNKPYSLQRFELNLGLEDYSYQNFNYLSFTAVNAGAAWRWSLTPRLRGNLTFDRKETPNSYLDYQGFRQRNQNTDTQTRFDAGYDIDGAWRVLAGVTRADQVNLLPVVALGDTSTASADIGLQYLFGSGSTLTYALKSADGKFLNRALQQETLLDDAYRQLDHEVRLSWVINGKSTADVSAAYIARTHPHFAQRDYSGFNTGINVNWGLTGKSTLGASWVRELASYQTDSTNYSQTDRLSLAPVWQISSKVALRARYELATRSFLGTPLGLAASGRSDTTRDASIALDWQPYERVSLGASFLNSRRESNLPGLDYNGNLATVFAKVSY
jgi:exopolysaccharide biosynthesis operon protein EpsL